MNFNAYSWLLSLSQLVASQSFASLHLYQAGILLMHPNSINPKVTPYESTIPSYMRYLPTVPSKFVCAKLQTFKWNSVLYARAAHVSTRAACIFHARWVIFKRSGLCSSLTRKGWNRDAQSHDPKRSKLINIIKQNSPRVVVSSRHSLFRASHGLMLVGGWGSINLYHSVW